MVQKPLLHHEPIATQSPERYMYHSESDARNPKRNAVESDAVGTFCANAAIEPTSSSLALRIRSKSDRLRPDELLPSVLDDLLRTCALTELLGTLLVGPASLAVRGRDFEGGI